MKCGTNNCEADAIVEVFWPGQPIKMCLDCADRANDINNAMGGVPLPIRPLPFDIDAHIQAQEKDET